MTGAIANSLFSYTTAIMTPAADEIYGLGPSQAAILTLCATPSFLLGAKLAHLLTAKKIMKRRNIIFMSMIISGTCEFFCTGEIYFITPNPQLWLVGTMMFFQGATLAFLFVMTFPEMVEAAEVHLITTD